MFRREDQNAIRIYSVIDSLNDLLNEVLHESDEIDV